MKCGLRYVKDLNTARLSQFAIIVLQQSRRD